MPDPFMSDQSLSTSIQRPRCPNCGSRRMRARISLLPSAVDLRMCECVTCSQVFKAPDPADPMNPEPVGWLAGDLRPPS